MKKKNFIAILALSTLLFGCAQETPVETTTNVSTEASQSIDALGKAKEDANELLGSINIEDYINEEREEVAYLIAGLTALIEDATSPEQLYAAISSIQEYLENAKTKAEYEAEAAAKDEADFLQRKQDLLKKASLEKPNRFRKQEQDTIKAIGEGLKTQIEAATTMDELNAISFDAFDAAVASSPTNAELMVKEWYYFHENSKWDLVNQHAANWPYEKSTFRTNGLGVDDVAYQITSNKYHGNLEVLLSCNNTVNASENFGFLIGNMNPTGNGFDGYLINYAYTTDHQYLQIWQFINANAPEAATVYQYIGGWEYEKSYNTKLNQDDIRFFYDGEYITLYRDAEYQQKGELANCCTVSLAYNNRYSLEPGSDYSVGFFNWDGANLAAPRILEVKEFITEEVIDSKEPLTLFATNAINKVNMSLYETEEQQAISQKGQELQAFIQNSTSHEASFNKIMEFNDFVASTKTAEQKEMELHPDISVTILDNIYSGDLSKYTPSNWDLVNEHALAWTHTPGSHTVVTDGLAGYCMDAAVHTDFTVVFKVTGTQPENPYNFSMPGSALIIGGNINGSYFTGYEIVLSQNWGFQLYDSMTGANNDPACYPDQFRGGYETNSEGVTYRITLKNGIMKLYTISANGLQIQITGKSQNFEDVTEWNLGNLSGHFGIMDWGGATTYEILEFRDL